MRDLFTLKLEHQFILFISILLVVHLSLRLLEWPGHLACLILIPLLFSLINLIVFFIKGLSKSIWEFKYFLFIPLYLIIPLKFQFEYYNFLLPLTLVLFSIYLLRNHHFKIPSLKDRLVLLVTLNILIIIVPDILIYKYIHSSNKQVWGEKLTWSNFKGSEPWDIGEMDARVYTDFYWRYNKVYNIPRYISLSVMKESISWFRPKYIGIDQNLLNHEQLHFDITEWTRREFEDSLSNIKNLNFEKANDIYNYFQLVRSSRQAKYDSISKHGTDFNGQIIWNKKVKLNLN